MKNIEFLLLESPLQVISAAEACFHFDFKEPYVVSFLAVSDRTKHNQLMKSCIKFFQFTNTLSVKQSKHTIFNSLSLIFLLVRGLIIKNRVSTICIGDWRSTWMLLILLTVRPSRVILLDDGVITTNVVQQPTFGNTVTCLENTASRFATIFLKIFQPKPFIANVDFELVVFSAYLKNIKTKKFFCDRKQL